MSIPTISQGASTFIGRTVLARFLFLSVCWQVLHTFIWNSYAKGNTLLSSCLIDVSKPLWSRRCVYPVNHVLDDPQPVVLALDPVDSLLLAQVMTDVIEVAVEKYLPLPLSLYHHLPLLFFLGSHIVQLAILNVEQSEKWDMPSKHFRYPYLVFSLAFLDGRTTDTT